MNEINFEELKQKIIPYFINYYGIENKELVESKINKIVPIFYKTIEQEKTQLISKDIAKKIELTIKMIDFLHLDVPEEVKQEMVERNSTMPLSEFTETKNILTSIFNSCEYSHSVYGGITKLSKEPITNDYQLTEMVNSLERFGITINKDAYNTWINTPECDELITRIQSIKDYLNILNANYEMHKQKYQELEETIKKSESLKSSLEEKTMIEFLDSMQEYLSSKDKQLLEEYKTSERKDWYTFKRNLDFFKIIGNSFYDNSILEAFSFISDEKLNNPEIPNHTKSYIIDTRIKYFELIGLFKDSMTKEEFLSSEIARNHTPNVDLIEHILETKIKYRTQLENEYLKSSSTYDENMEQIKELNIDGKSSFSLDVIKNKVNCINPNTRTVNGKRESVPLLFYSKGAALNDFADVFFIHEINHAIELSLLSDDKEHFKCGFEYLTDNEEEERPYELFSEYINQMTAIEITDAMHSDGVFLFDNPAKSRTKGSTSYEQIGAVCKNFFTNFQETIKQARIDNNLDLLLDEVGIDNFNRLNEIVKEYASLAYYQMMNDVVNKNDTPLVQTRNKLIEESNELMVTMLAYNKQAKILA